MLGLVGRETRPGVHSNLWLHSEFRNPVSKNPGEEDQTTCYCFAYEYLTMLFWLARNSQRSACPCLPNAGFQGVYHHASHNNIFFFKAPIQMFYCSSLLEMTGGSSLWLYMNCTYFPGYLGRMGCAAGGWVLGWSWLPLTEQWKAALDAWRSLHTVTALRLYAQDHFVEYAPWSLGS